MIILLSLILGLLLGYFARDIHTKITQTYEYFKDRMESPPGVVRPVGHPVTRNQPIDLTSETGGVLKPTPAAIEDQRQADRARILQENHR